GKSVVGAKVTDDEVVTVLRAHGERQVPDAVPMTDEGNPAASSKNMFPPELAPFEKVAVTDACPAAAATACQISTSSQFPAKQFAPINCPRALSRTHALL